MQMMSKKRTEKKKNRGSRKLRQLRLLVLIGLLAGVVFYWTPLIGIFQGLLPSGRTAAVNNPAVILSAQEAATAVRKGIVYTMTGKTLKAIKPEDSVLWEKNTELASASVLPSYDGVFVVPPEKDRLYRYSTLGKLMNEVPVPGPFTHIYESVSGILFEDRPMNQYTWTDISGKVLGSQQVAEEHILKTAMDSETGDTIIATLKTDGGTLESALHRYDSNGRLMGARTFKDSVLLNMQFIQSQLVVILDDRMISLDSQMKDHWIVREPARYQAVSFGSDKFWVERVQTGFKETQVLQCYSKEGKALLSLPFDRDITLLSAGDGNQVAVGTGQKIQVYSEKGNLTAEMQLAKVPQKILWLDGKHLLIFYGDSVSIMSVGKGNSL